MRLAWIFVVWIGCQAALGQDPTVPSSTILKRLKGEPVAAIANIPERLPQMSIKAMVMVDGEHGTAIIQVDDRRIRLRLDRQQAVLSRRQLVPNQNSNMASAELLVDQAGSASAQTTSSVGAVQLNATPFYVVDFSAHSIVLSDGRRELVVQ